MAHSTSTPIAANGRRPSSATATASTSTRRIEFISVVLPCLNEEDAVGATVGEALTGLARVGIPGEVIVVDNGSSDRSVERAEAAGARVIHEPIRGHGSAHMAGMAAARGNVVVIADADQTYDLERMGDLLAPLTDGADMVIGSRLQGEISKGAMPTLHRYLGTPIQTMLLRVLTGIRLSDCHSGYKAFWRDRVAPLNLRARGFDYQTEMLLKAGRAGLTLKEVPTDYRVRVGESKLSTLRDGWLNTQMLLLLSPHFTLIFPGLSAALLGLLFCLMSLIAPAGIEIVNLQWLPVFLGPMLLILGVQAAFLGCIAAHRSTLTPIAVRRRLAFFDRPDAVNRLLGGFLVVALVGLLLDAILLVLWLADRSGDSLIGVAGLAQALIVIGGSGIATVFAADYSRESLGW